MVGSLGPGDIIREKYRLERVLGQGGMAVVVAAWHMRLQQRVAIKFLRPETAWQPEVVERFLREARAASQIEGSAVARVIDVDTLENGAPFIVMEYLEGHDLSWVVRDRRSLPSGEAANYVRQACAALSEAHSLGIIHRDIKPANLFLARKRSGETRVVVLDFGISKLLADTGITKTSVAMGSAAYTSPEQMQSSRDVDGRTDIWALGVTLYELCTGRTPFVASSVGGLWVAVMNAKPVPPRSVLPDLPAGLEAVILRCLEKDPDRRFASADALAAALAPFASAETPRMELETLSLFSDTSPSGAAEIGADTQFSNATTKRRMARPRWSQRVIMGVVVLVSVVVGILLVALTQH